MSDTGSGIASASCGASVTASRLKRETLRYDDGAIRATGMLDSAGMKRNQWLYYRKNGDLEKIVYYCDDMKHGPYVKIKEGRDLDGVEFYQFGESVQMPLVRQAVEYAYERHFGAVRKGSGNPYILHPLEALGIAFGIEAESEILLAAAVLHDVLEDTQTTASDLQSRFGAVSDIVVEETEDKSKSWRERKQATIDYLRSGRASYEARVVALADKLSNVRSAVEELAELGAAFWERFREKDPQKQKWYYREVCEALREFSGRSEWQELNAAVEELE